jgi:hypothetical protein
MRLVVPWEPRRPWPKAEDVETVAADKRHERFDFVPKPLRGKFPIAWIIMLENNMRIVLEITQLVLSFLILYGTILGPPHRSEWIYLLTASFGPVAFAVWYIVFPMNPYRSIVAIREPMKDMDKTDPDAAELVALLESSEAHRFLLKTGWKLSSLFFVPMAIISFAMHKIPSWRIGADSAVRIPAFFLICLFTLFRMELLAWALKNWGKVQTELSVNRMK